MNPTPVCTPNIVPTKDYPAAPPPCRIDPLDNRVYQTARQTLTEKEKDALIASLQGRVRVLTVENEKLKKENEELGNTLIVQAERIATLEAKMEDNQTAFLKAIDDVNNRCAILDENYKIAKGTAIASVIVGVVSLTVGVAAIGAVFPAVPLAVLGAARVTVKAIKSIV